MAPGSKIVVWLEFSAAPFPSEANDTVNVVTCSKTFSLCWKVYTFVFEQVQPIKKSAIAEIIECETLKYEQDA